MSFFRQLSRGAKKCFGRQLGKDVSWFGRQLSTGARKMGGGIGQAQQVISSLERATKGVPVLGDVYKLSSIGLKGLHGLSNIGQTAGGGLQALGSGDLVGTARAGRDIYNQGKGSLGDAKDFAKVGVPLATAALAFL